MCVQCNKDLKRCKSRELRASILYTSCDCIKRNGLQDSCPRSECQGQPQCMVFPEPLCCPAKHAQRYINIRKNIRRLPDKCSKEKNSDQKPNCPHCQGPCKQTSACPQQNSQKSGCAPKANDCPQKSDGCRMGGGSDGDGPQYNNNDNDKKNIKENDKEETQSNCFSE